MEYFFPPRGGLSLKGVVGRTPMIKNQTNKKKKRQTNKKKRKETSLLVYDQNKIKMGDIFLSRKMKMLQVAAKFIVKKIYCTYTKVS